MSDLMREEFEAAIVSEFKSVGCIAGPDLCRSENNGDYLNQVVGGAWWAWQASRECLVIELPKPAGLDRMCSEMSMQEIREDNRFNRALELAKKALTAAGVKYK